MYSIGIDLSRSTGHFYASDDETRSRLGSGKFELTSKEIRALCERYPGGRFALEAGSSTFRIAREIQSCDGKVFVVNPYTNFLIRKSMQKTDALDAKSLCEQLQEGKLPRQPVYVPTAEVEELRDLLSFRASLVRQRSSAIIRVKLLACRNEIYLTGKSLGSKKAWQALKVTTDTWPSAHSAMFSAQHELFHALHNQIHELEWKIAEAVETLFPTEVRLLETVPCIGQLSIAVLLAYIADIERFKNARQLCSYVGLAPALRDSGQHKSKLGITKTGNPLLRQYLTQAVLQVRTLPSDNSLVKWHANVARRRGWRKARLALARKIVAIVFGVLKHKRPFDASLLELD